MPQPARQPAYVHRNATPPWIVCDGKYKKLKSQHRLTLQGICNKANPPADAFGDLVGVFGGQTLLEACGCEQRTFWRHLIKLEVLGYVVTLGRGGTYNGKNYGNQYGVPGQRGSLNAQKAKREMRCMVKGADQKFRPRVIEPGSQIKLWNVNHSEARKVTQGGPKSDTGVVSNRHKGQPLKPTRGSCHFDKLDNNFDGKVSRTPCQSDTPVNETELKNHFHIETEDDVANRNEIQKPTSPEPFWPYRILALEELKCDQTLCLLFDAACSSGLMHWSEDDRLWFFSAAENALRMAKYPPAFFVKLIRKNAERRLFPTNVDEDRAAKRLKNYLCEEIPS